MVTLPIAAPITPVTVNVPPPPAPAEPEPVMIAPRVVKPLLAAGCLLNEESDPSSPVDCSWSDGLPAISGDGATIAVKEHPGDGGRGYPSVVIRFIDVASSKVTGTTTIVSPDAGIDGETSMPTKAERAKIVRRVAAVQRRLDDQGYRSLVALPKREEGERGGVRAEIPEEQATIRIVDDDAHVVLWQERFPAQREYPDRQLAEDDPRYEGCYPSQTRELAAFWDPRTRAILAQASYASGPCYCDDVIHYYVRRAAD
jgi:hypothetical protein